MSEGESETNSILLVVPCYKERLRLPKFLPDLSQAVQQSNLPVRIQVVDDGSPEDEAAFLKGYVEEQRSQYDVLNEPLLLEENQGKGGAIRSGWDTGHTFKTLAFVDADGAVSASEVGRVLKDIESDRVYLAVRDRKHSHSLDRKLTRKAAAKLFNTLIRLRYDIDVSDTQCGFKIIPGDFYRSVRSRLKQSSYAFDLELILAAKNAGYPIETIPVDWTEIPGSSTNLKEAITFLKQLLRRSV